MSYSNDKNNSAEMHRTTSRMYQRHTGTVPFLVKTLVLSTTNGFSKDINFAVNFENMIIAAIKYRYTEKN